MSDEEKKKDAARLPAKGPRETFFLPPLKMILCFFDKESPQGEEKSASAEKQEKSIGKNVEKLIEKLSEKDE